MTVSTAFVKIYGMLEELESARAIIDILQREAPITTTIESTCDKRTITKE